MLGYLFVNVIVAKYLRTMLLKKEFSKIVWVVRR